MRYLQYVYTSIGKHTPLVISTLFSSKNEGLFKVTAYHVYCKCGNISETVQDGFDRFVVTVDH